MTAPLEHHTSPELTTAPDDSRFLVHNPQEILRILRGLAHRGELVSAFFNNGKELLLTTVLETDPASNAIWLDYGSNEGLNQRILDSDKIIFVTSLDSVKIQFVTHHLDKTTFEGQDAFRCAIPGQVLQLQRREYYRLTTPIINPLKCLIPLENGRSVEAPLADIGGGGIGILLGQPPGLELEPGQMFPGCRISLPEVGVLEMTLRIQTTFEVTLKNGSKVMRSGCQFLDLRPAMQSLIQRYIVKQERERIAHSSR